MLRDRNFEAKSALAGSSARSLATSHREALHKLDRETRHRALLPIVFVETAGCVRTCYPKNTKASLGTLAFRQ